MNTEVRPLQMANIRNPANRIDMDECPCIWIGQLVEETSSDTGACWNYRLDRGSDRRD